MNDPGLGTLVTYNPTVVRVDTPLTALAERLLDCGFHHWPVVDGERRVVGIISDADIARCFSEAAVALAGRNVNMASPPRQMTALDIMSPRVTTIEMSTPWQTALAMLIDQQVHSLPVVDHGVLLGIVTSSDFLREFSHGQLPGSRESVAALMIKVTETIEADADIDCARAAMLMTGHAHLTVVKGGCPLGVISRRTLHMARCLQLVRLALDATSDHTIHVRELIRTAPNVKPGDRAATAAQLMVDFSVQAVAVVNQAHRLLGVVSEDDLLQAMLSAGREPASKPRDIKPASYSRTCSK